VRIEIVTDENDPPATQVLTDDRDLIAFAGADATADRAHCASGVASRPIIKAVPDRAQLPSHSGAMALTPGLGHSPVSISFGMGHASTCNPHRPLRRPSRPR
jgi:hypothetical protein